MNAALFKRWKVSETLLKRAHAALPRPESDEHELALDTLEELGDLVATRGGFWKDLMRAAENMTLLDRIPKLQKKFDDALARKRSTGTA